MPSSPEGTAYITALAAVVAMMMVGSVAAAQQSVSPASLVEQFKNTPVFWRQFEIAKELAKVADARALAALEPLLRDDDRHVRANAAFVFGSRGDARGLETLKTILADRTDRPLGQGIPGALNPGARWMPIQIRADRYYAVHVLGELKDPRGVDILIPLLGDPEVNYKAAWALGQIRDRRAIGPLIKTLADRDARVRVSAIEALVALDAQEALPQLRALLNDQALSGRVTVAETAKAAIAKLQKKL